MVRIMILGDGSASQAAGMEGCKGSRVLVFSDLGTHSVGSDTWEARNVLVGPARQPRWAARRHVEGAGEGSPASRRGTVGSLPRLPPSSFEKENTWGLCGGETLQTEYTGSLLPAERHRFLGRMPAAGARQRQVCDPFHQLTMT